MFSKFVERIFPVLTKYFTLTQCTKSSKYILLCIDNVRSKLILNHLNKYRKQDIKTNIYCINKFVSMDTESNTKSPYYKVLNLSLKI